MAKAPPEKHSPPPSKKTPPPPPPPKASAKPPAGGKPVAGKPVAGKQSPAKAPAKPAPPAKPVAAKPAPPARAEKPRKPQPAFGKKNQPPTAAAFAARLPVTLGKRFDYARAYLLKQDGVREDVYFYGPETGWALRYLVGDRPLCSLHVYDEEPLGIISLDPAESAIVDWRGLSPVGQKARKQAHGSPALLWLDLPLQGTGAGDFKALLRAKLAAQSEAQEDEGDDAATNPRGGRALQDDVVDSPEDAEA
jgi:hypothetical protein